MALQSPSISLLFIDSKLWAKFSPGPQGYELQVHTSGASPEDIVIVTSEPILAAVLDGTMPAQKALDLGLIAIDGKQDEAEAMRHVVVAATDRARASAVAGSPLCQSDSSDQRDKFQAPTLEHCARNVRLESVATEPFSASADHCPLFPKSRL